MSAAADSPPPQAVLMGFVTGVWAARAVAGLARLGVADHLADEPRSAAQLAPTLAVPADALHRLLRAGSTLGVLASDREARFSLTPIGQCLRSGVPGSMRAFIIGELDAPHWQGWGQADESFRTGEPAPPKVLGMSIWEYYRRHPEEGRFFDEGMTALSEAEIHSILAAYMPRQARRIVDIGGGHGALLAAILGREPQARGVLFDQPQVVQQAAASLQRLGMAARIECVEGDFFDAVPAGGDLYLLKHILHDWNDAECVRILRRVREAMSPQGRVMVAEMPIFEDGTASPAALMDLNMLVMITGRERTPDEYAALFARAGLRLAELIRTGGPLALLEGQPAAE